MSQGIDRKWVREKYHLACENNAWHPGWGRRLMDWRGRWLRWWNEALEKRVQCQKKLGAGVNERDLPQWWSVDLEVLRRMQLNAVARKLSTASRLVEILTIREGSAN
jgi:hypothetical protein